MGSPNSPTSTNASPGPTRTGVWVNDFAVGPGDFFNQQPLPNDFLEVLARLGELKREFGLPVLISVSRKSFLRALTIVNERGRRRGFWGRYAAGGAVTFGAVIVALVLISAFTLAPILFDQLGADADLALQILRPVILLALITASAMALYRWGPARRAPAWRWVWPGAVVAALVWILVTAGFSFYVDVFTP